MPAAISGTTGVQGIQTAPTESNPSATINRLFEGISQEDRGVARAYLIAKLSGEGRLQITRQELLAAGLSDDAQAAVVAAIAYAGAVTGREVRYEAALQTGVQARASAAGCRVECRPQGFMVLVDRVADDVSRVTNATLGPTLDGVSTVLEDGVAKPLAAVGGALELILQAGVVQPVTIVVRDGVVKPMTATLRGAAAVPLGVAPGLEAVGKSLLMGLTLGFWRPQRRR